MAQTQAQSVISVRNLRMGYGTRVLLDDASFEVYRKEIVVILGGSGAASRPS
jgi:phospholipid/cholesterol/gamma-HCH transport system ATP-binding protein